VARGSGKAKTKSEEAISKTVDSTSKAVARDQWPVTRKKTIDTRQQATGKSGQQNRDPWLVTRKSKNQIRRSDQLSVKKQELYFHRCGANIAEQSHSLHKHVILS